MKRVKAVPVCLSGARWAGCRKEARTPEILRRSIEEPSKFLRNITLTAPELHRSYTVSIRGVQDMRWRVWMAMAKTVGEVWPQFLKPWKQPQKSKRTSLNRAAISRVMRFSSATLWAAKVTLKRR